MSEEQLRELAERQHGVVATWQVDGDARTTRRGASGHWEQVTPSVLRRRGSPVTFDQRVMAAVLDGGEGALASHGTAAALWRLPGFGTHGLEVMRAGRRTSRNPPIAQLHRPRLLLPHHSTKTTGIPVTTLARTLFDLAAVGVAPSRIGRLVNMVCNRSPGTLRALHQTLDELAARGRAGIGTMRQVLAERPVGSVLVASGLEMRFEEILREAGEPPLRRQVDLGGHEWLGRVDFYDDELLAVFEVDSILHHTSPMDQQRDRLRDEVMLANGIRAVSRIPEEHLWYRPHLAVDAVRSTRRRLRSNWVQLKPHAGFSCTQFGRDPAA
jgi:very-short-patch-repair endonuclease